jgi:hypothetical protein
MFRASDTRLIWIFEHYGIERAGALQVLGLRVALTAFGHAKSALACNNNSASY